MILFPVSTFGWTYKRTPHKITFMLHDKNYYMCCVMNKILNLWLISL